MGGFKAETIYVAALKCYIKRGDNHEGFLIIYR